MYFYENKKYFGKKLPTYCKFVKLYKLFKCPHFRNKFYVYATLAWVTRRCPGWFKWGIKNSIETQDLIWYQKYVGIARHSYIRLAKRWPAPTKLGVPYNFCLIKFSPKRTVEAAEAPHTPFTHPVPGGWGYWVETPPQEPSPPQGPPTCQILSRSIQPFGFL